MARILRRPMFRRGGMPSNQGVTAVRPQYMGGGMGGIMSGIVPRPDAGLTPRVGYQALGKVKSFEELQKENRLKQDIANKKPFLTPLQIEEEYKKLVESAESGLGVMGLDEEGPGTFTERAQTDFDTIQSEEGKKAFIGELTKKEKEKEKKLIKDGIISPEESVFGKKPSEETPPPPSGEPTETTKSEFERIFGEYLPVIQDQLKPDEDSAVRDRYLALAKFGTSLMGQPGGDLAGAVGKASQQPLTDLSKIAAQERKDKQTPKLLALQATLDRMKQDGKSTLDKQLNYQRINESAKGISKDGQVGYNEAFRIAERKALMGSEGGKYNSLYPETKEKLKKIIGPKFFYTKDGTLKVVKDGDTFTPEQWAKEPKEK
tara:strand:- start:163 stop:1287 length:1125 start_codon:yes stop_codon:yes gene_type:complete